MKCGGALNNASMLRFYYLRSVLYLMARSLRKSASQDVVLWLGARCLPASASEDPSRRPIKSTTDGRRPDDTHAQTWPPTCNRIYMKKQDTSGSRTYTAVLTRARGTESGSAGQSGDNQGLSDVAEVGPESIAELVDEGQAFEADVIDGVENAPDADVSEVHTKQVNEDDVPPEYIGQD